MSENALTRWVYFVIFTARGGRTNALFFDSKEEAVECANFLRSRGYAVCTSQFDTEMLKN